MFYKKLRRELENYGMIMNPYNMCVANKGTEKGHQLTILWHVDDLKISCRDRFKVTKLICYLRRIYGEKMMVHQGGKGKYLGMHLDFTENRIFQVDMSKYIEGIIEEFSEIIKKSSPSPHSETLFTVKDEELAKLLPECKAMQFHRTTSRLLFLSTQAQNNLQTAVLFLTTRVKQPDKDNWVTLRRVLDYLYGTKSLKLHIQVDSL